MTQTTNPNASELDELDISRTKWLGMVYWTPDWMVTRISIEYHRAGEREPVHIPPEETTP